MWTCLIEVGAKRGIGHAESRNVWENKYFERLAKLPGRIVAEIASLKSHRTACEDQGHMDGHAALAFAMMALAIAEPWRWPP